MVVRHQVLQADRTPLNPPPPRHRRANPLRHGGQSHRFGQLHESTKVGIDAFLSKAG